MTVAESDQTPHVEVLEARGVKMVCQIATDKIVNVATSFA